MMAAAGQMRRMRLRSSAAQSCRQQHQICKQKLRDLESEQIEAAEKTVVRVPSV